MRPVILIALLCISCSSNQLKLNISQVPSSESVREMKSIETVCIIPSFGIYETIDASKNGTDADPVMNVSREINSYAFVSLAEHNYKPTIFYSGNLDRSRVRSFFSKVSEFGDLSVRDNGVLEEVSHSVRADAIVMIRYYGEGASDGKAAAELLATAISEGNSRSSNMRKVELIVYDNRSKKILLYKSVVANDQRLSIHYTYQEFITALFEGI